MDIHAANGTTTYGPWHHVDEAQHRRMDNTTEAGAFPKYADDLTTEAGASRNSPQATTPTFNRPPSRRRTK